MHTLWLLISQESDGSRRMVDCKFLKIILSSVSPRRYGHIGPFTGNPDAMLTAFGVLEKETKTMSPKSTYGGILTKPALLPLGCTTSGPSAAESGSGLASPSVPIGSAEGGGGGAFVRLGLTRRRINMPMTRRNSKNRIFLLVYFF